MNILSIIDSLNQGGAEKMAMTIANSLSRYGINSYLCITREKGAFEKYILPEVNIYFLEKKSTIDISALLRLRKYIIDNQIQIIHAHTFSIFIALLAKYFPFKLTGLRIVWHYHCGIYPLFGWQIQYYHRIFLHFADKVIVVDESANSLFQKFLKSKKNKVEFIENYIIPNQNIKVNNVNLPGKSSKRIVSVATINPRKDQITLIKAFFIVIKQVPDAHLFLIGTRKDISYYNDLNKKINYLELSQNVTILDDIDNVLPLLVNMDIGVISSQAEGTPLALLEYGLAQLAVVTTNVGKCGDIVENGVSGLVVPPRDEIKLAGAILRFLKCEEFRKKAGKAIYKKINTNYSEKVAVEKIIKIYKEII